MKLFNHAYFGRVKLYGFGNIGPTFFLAFWVPCTTILAITFLENVFRKYFAYHLVQHEILSHVTYWKGVKGNKGQRSTR